MARALPSDRQRFEEYPMPLQKEFAEARARWKLLTFYEKFEHSVILVLTALIAVVVMFAVWNLALRIFASILRSAFDPTDYQVFQAIFGMVFTVIIALEFKRSLLVVAERSRGVVQVRAVILLALLAVVRKLLIIDLSSTDGLQLLALAAAILALGSVFWLIRDQDRRDTDSKRN
jgi:uncharacterized membrane protein (DUF373 family)